jgi:hypothetical protein
MAVPNPFGGGAAGRTIPGGGSERQRNVGAAGSGPDAAAARREARRDDSCARPATPAPGVGRPVRDRGAAEGDRPRVRTGTHHRRTDPRRPRSDFAGIPDPHRTPSGAPPRGATSDRSSRADQVRRCASTSVSRRRHAASSRNGCDPGGIGVGCRQERARPCRARPAACGRQRRERYVLEGGERFHARNHADESRRAAPATGRR